MSELNFSNLTVEYVENLCNQYMKEMKEFNDSLLLIKNEDITWFNFIGDTLQFDKDWIDRCTVFNMSYFHPDEKIRDVCSKSDTVMSEFGIEQNMRKDLFEKFKHYYYNQYQQEKTTFSDERVRYVENLMKEHRINGLELPNEKYEKVKELNKQVSTHSINFNNNLNKFNKEFILTDEQLTGMSSDWLQSRKVDSDNDNDNETDNRYKINLKYPDYFPIMERCTNRDTRKMIFSEFYARCYDENKPIIDVIFKLRNEIAKEFDFNFYSDYKLQMRMAKNTSNVMNFLNDLQNKLKPILDSDYLKILSISSADGINTLDELKPHDIPFYSTKYIEQHTELNMDDIKIYFPLDQTIKGTFDIYKTLLGFTFVDITDKYTNTLWNSDIKLYQVLNSCDGSLQGEFYLDLHPRDGKYGHAAVFPIRYGSTQKHPVCIMACNFPCGENLSFDNVVTFFHEFGHVMHTISSRPEIASLAGTNVERDAVECPSQMLEEWCYRPNSLKVLSPELPDEVITKLIKQQNLLEGCFNSKQLVLCMIDMELHGASHNCPDPNQLFSTIYKSVLKLDLPENHGFLQTFGHLMGYQAGYYGYLYSKSFSKCLFEEKFLNHELDPVVGMEYRNKIIAPGGTKDFMDLMIDFLGHPPTNDAFIKSLTS